MNNREKRVAEAFKIETEFLSYHKMNWQAKAKQDKMKDGYKTNRGQRNAIRSLR